MDEDIFEQRMHLDEALRFAVQDVLSQGRVGGYSFWLRWRRHHTGKTAPREQVKD